MAVVDEVGPPGGAFWDGLLKGQFEQLQALELAAMGKVRRMRTPPPSITRHGALGLGIATASSFHSIIVTEALSQYTRTANSFHSITMHGALWLDTADPI